MTQIISFISAKGGVGKSTLIYETFCRLIQDKRVLVIDMDYQATITRVLGQLTEQNTIIDSLINDGDLTPLEVIPDKLDLVPGYLLAEDLEVQAINQGLALNRLQEKISNLLSEKEKQYDYILIDTPSAFLYLTSIAAIACDQIVIPTVLSTTALADIKLIRNKLNLLYMRSMIPAEQFPKFKVVENLYNEDSAYDQRLDAQLAAELKEKQIPLLQVKRTCRFRQVLQNYQLAQENLQKIKKETKEDRFLRNSLADFVKA